MRLNKTTKRAQDFIERYNNSNMYELFDLYKSYSRDKWRAEYFIHENMKKLMLGAIKYYVAIVRHLLLDLCI